MLHRPSFLCRPGLTCSNGLPGIDGSNIAGVEVCCPVECNQCGKSVSRTTKSPLSPCQFDNILWFCQTPRPYEGGHSILPFKRDEYGCGHVRWGPVPTGGAGCGSNGDPGFDNTDCCPNGVIANQDDCIVTQSAPCVITDGKLFPATLADLPGPSISKCLNLDQLLRAISTYLYNVLSATPLNCTPTSLLYFVPCTDKQLLLHPWHPQRPHPWHPRHRRLWTEVRIAEYMYRGWLRFYVLAAEVRACPV